MLLVYWVRSSSTRIQDADGVSQSQKRKASSPTLFWHWISETNTELLLPHTVDGQVETVDVVVDVVDVDDDDGLEGGGTGFEGGHCSPIETIAPGN